MVEKYGFVYIWYDRKRKKYYIGSHWGTEVDGYVCSSNLMRNAYRRRPQDFKRRILSRVYSDRIELLNVEQKWLDIVKKKEIYYNLHYNLSFPWWAYPDQKLKVGEKLAKANSQRIVKPETKAKHAANGTGKRHSEETKAKMSAARKGRVQSAETKAKISHALKSRSDIPNRDDKGLFI